MSKNKKTSAQKNPAGRALGLIIASTLFGLGAFGWSQLGARSNNITLAARHTKSIKPLRTLHNDGNWVHAVVASPDGSTIISGDHKGQLKWWNAKRGSLVKSTKNQGHSDAISALAISSDGQTVVSGSWDNRVKVWDAITGELLRTLIHNNDVSAVDLSPSGELLASGGVDGTLRLWDLRTGQTINRMNTGSWIKSVSYHPKGNHIAFGNRNGNIKIFQLDQKHKPQLLHSLKGHKGDVAGLSFCNEGKILASGSADNTVKLWDVAEGSLLKAFAGHTSDVRSLAFSSDGKILASSSNDATVKLWSIDTGEILGNLIGHGKTVWDVTFSPDGQRIVSAGSDTTLKMWPVPNDTVATNPQGSVEQGELAEDRLELDEVETVPEQRVDTVSEQLEEELLPDQEPIDMETVYSSSGKVIRLQPKVKTFAEEHVSQQKSLPVKTVVNSIAETETAQYLPIDN